MSEDISTLKRQLTGLNRLHQLQKQLRMAESQLEIGYTMVNDTKQLVNYRQAFWWRPRVGVTHVSALAQVEKGTPFIRWCDSLCEALSKDDSAKHTPYVVTSASVDSDIAQAWHEFLPAHVMVLPLEADGSNDLGFLVLARETEWLDAETGFLSEVSDIFRFALQGQRRHAKTKQGKHTKKWLVGLSVAATIVALLPVRLSVLAPAEVVAKDALPVRAPYEGVINKVHVSPNEVVNAGDLLLTLDDTDLQNRIAIAEQELQIARTEYRQVAQQAVFDEKGKLEVAIRRGMVEKTSSELDYYKSLLTRTEVRAEASGIAVLTDANEWSGQPVALGEQVFTVADPGKVELSFELAIGDAIALDEQAEIKFFMNISPDAPITAQLDWLAYKATKGDTGTLSYAGRAVFADTQALPRVGLRGTARIYGERAPLVYYILRRPLSALRQWVGF